jgi:hypothetical protein
MKLEGSCHCGSVRFTVDSAQPVPFMRCYCSICRKTAGTGGFAVNLGADFRSLEVTGRQHISTYRARMEDGTHSSAERSFCRHCGTALWLWDPTWPDLVHPHAGAVDTPLPAAPAYVHIMLGSKPAWVAVEGRSGDERFEDFPDVSLAQWHENRGLTA